MSTRRDRRVRARDVSLRRGAGALALAIMTLGLTAVPSAYAQEPQPAEAEEPKDAVTEESATTDTSTGSSEVARLYDQAGRTFYRNGQYAEAIEQFRQAYTAEPTANRAYNIARSHERLSKWKDAIEWYQTYVAMTADPTDRAEALEKIESLREKLGVDEGSPEAKFKARMNSGRAKYKVGDYEAAIEEFRAAFDIKAAPAALYNIAKSYENWGRWEEAADYYQQYLDQDPNATDRANVEATIRQMQERIRDRYKELTIKTDPPGADIFIDDAKELQGQTNKTLKLEPGEHTLYITKNGYEPVKRVVTLDDENLSLEFKLKELENVGYLQISVDEDGARIFIDGAIVGLSPFTQKKKLEAGQHQIQIEKIGFSRWTKKIEVVRDQEITVEADLSAPISDDTLTSWGSGLFFTGLIGGGIGFFTPFIIQQVGNRRPYFEQLGPDSLSGTFYRQGAPGEEPNTRDNSELNTMELIQMISLIAGGTLVVAGSVFYIVKWSRTSPKLVTAGVDVETDQPLVSIDSFGVVPTDDGAAVGLSGSF